VGLGTGEDDTRDLRLRNQTGDILGSRSTGDTLPEIVRDSLRDQFERQFLSFDPAIQA